MKPQTERLQNGDTPRLTIVRAYTTFGGGGISAYRTEIRKGTIPFREMEQLLGYAPAGGSFEITDVTDDSVSFVVNADSSASGKAEIHTLPLRNGAVMFHRREERRSTIEGDDFTYEVTHTLKLWTSERILNVYATVTRETEKGKTQETVHKILPYAPGEYELGPEYPFSKNVYTSVDSGYYFGRLYVKDDMRIRYLDEDPRPALTGDIVKKYESMEFVRQFGHETVEIRIYAE
ncbi:MAG: hypothetical protein IKM00_03005 [Clostridia bacterium]|nr:hypothetical protein [Clostridia bacterium]MBR6744169.1 hypothetical protein [Clostridia bacterium]